MRQVFAAIGLAAVAAALPACRDVHGELRTTLVYSVIPPLPA